MILCRLNKLIKENNITQSEIAEQTGITRPTLLSLIRNDNKSIKYETIEKLCQYFQINMDKFLIYYPHDIQLSSFNIIRASKEIYITIEFKFNGELLIFSEAISKEDIEFLNRFNRIDLFAYINKSTLNDLKAFNAVCIFNDLMHMHKDFYDFQRDLFYEFNGKGASYDKTPYQITLVPLEKQDSPFENVMNNLDKLSANEKNVILNKLQEKY
ncbi:helix-turn-helix transcriptional regulator [Staphylococcus chromogenes]|uniref:helix-turn-helix domain-containing protein n=1 Tax=Staphylococcus chromogenes TaxID=46126 RepID=UPI003AFFD807